MEDNKKLKYEQTRLFEVDSDLKKYELLETELSGKKKDIVDSKTGKKLETVYL